MFTQLDLHKLHKLRQSAATAPMLDVDEERSLILNLRKGSERAMATLIRSHLRLVLSIVDRYYVHGISQEDLISEGILGVVEAARRFEPEKGTRFATYAAWWIRACVRRYAIYNRRIVAPPSTRSARRLVSNLRQVQRDISQRQGREARPEEVAAVLGVETRDVEMMEAALAGQDVPFDAGAQPQDFRTSLATPEQRTADAEIEVQRLKSLENALGVLTLREREIVKQRILNEDVTTLNDLARRYGLSQERIRQIQKRAQSKLREAILGQFSGARMLFQSSGLEFAATVGA